MTNQKIALQLTLQCVESGLLSYIDNKSDKLNYEKMQAHNANNAQIVAKFYKQVLSEIVK